MLKSSQIWQVIDSELPRGSWQGIQAIYQLVERCLSLSPEDCMPSSPGGNEPKWLRNVRNVLQQRKDKGDIAWDGNANYLVSDLYREELKRRLTLLSVLKEGRECLPYSLDRLGIVVDLDTALAVVTHDPDESLMADGMYLTLPTIKGWGQDAIEIGALRKAGDSGLPILVSSTGYARAGFQTHQLGWIQYWNESGFYIQFGNRRPKKQKWLTQDWDSTSFVVTTSGRTLRTTEVRLRDFEFRHLVFQRYGAKCAFCGLSVPPLLQAAHIVPVAEGGTDDPRNGLVLCANHHLAFDHGMVGICPDNFSIKTLVDADSRDLGITEQDLGCLSARPHLKALRMRWEYRQGRKGIHVSDIQS